MTDNKYPETVSLHDEVLEGLPEANIQNYTEVCGSIIEETRKAVLVCFSFGEFESKEVWLPKSQIAKMDDGPYRRFMVANWLVRKKRLYNY